MKKITIFLLCLFLLHLVYSEFQAESFARPWQNRSWVTQNPNIWHYGLEVWYNLPEFQRTLESLKIENAYGLNLSSSVKSSLNESILRKQIATNDLIQCKNALSFAGFSLYIVPPFSSIVFIESFLGIGACLDYRNQWIGSVDASLSALEKSTNILEQEIDVARDRYNDIRSLGFCNRNYTYIGSEVCPDFQKTFDSTQNNVSEIGFGQYVLFIENKKKIDPELYQSIPDLSLVGSSLSLLWNRNGTISHFRSLTRRADEAKTKAETHFQLLENTVKLKKQLAEQEIVALSAQDFTLITRAPSSPGFSKTGAINERFLVLSKKVRELRIPLSLASNLRYRTDTPGYLADSISVLNQIDADYQKFMLDIASLDADAARVVEEQKQEANSEIAKSFQQISSSSPITAIIELDSAKQLFDDAEQQPTLGKKFLAYSRAAAFARSARLKAQQNETKTQEKNQTVPANFSFEVEFAAKLAELEDLIIRAEKDQINVVSEKAKLSLLKNSQNQNYRTLRALEIIEEDKNNIIEKAKIKYDSRVLATREAIYQQLNVLGPPVADLFVDLTRYEKDYFDDYGLIIYSNAIGNFRELISNYASLNAVLKQYSQEFVGNGMSATATPIIKNRVMLDESVNISLNLVLHNPTNYNASNVTVPIHLLRPAWFVYSDIVAGKDQIVTLRNKDDQLLLTLKKVEPFETKHIVFEKEEIVAHTRKKTVLADGIGSGEALVSERTEFELDNYLPTGLFVQSSENENAQIDGASASRPLIEGKHTLVREYTLQPAYLENITNIKSFKIGTKNKLEYDIRITPLIDLENVLIFAPVHNNSDITNLEITSATGELIKEKKRLSENEYSITLARLKKNKIAIVKVGYTIEDSKKFVEGQIRALPLSSLPTGPRQMVEQAKQQAEKGNYTKAIELIETAKNELKNENTERVKLEKLSSQLTKKIKSEIDEINLVSIAQNNSSDPFVAKLMAREKELQKVLNNTKDLNLSEKVDQLSKVDTDWLDKQVLDTKKNAYKEYNALKERFFKAGNSSTPAEFIEFEKALNKLDASLRPEYALETTKVLEKVRAVVETQEKAIQTEKSTLRSALDSTSNELKSFLRVYLKEAANAKGTEYASLFTETEKEINQKITEAENALTKDPRLFQFRFAELNKTKDNIVRTVESLRNQTKTEYAFLEDLINKSQLDEEKKQKLQERLRTIRKMIASGDYINSLKAMDALTKELDGKAVQNNNLFLLGITAFVVLITAILYVVKKRPQGGEKIKPLQKIERVDGSPP